MSDARVALDLAYSIGTKAVLFPLNRVKLVQQQAYVVPTPEKYGERSQNILRTFSHIRSQGTSHLWRGFLPDLLRSFPSRFLVAPIRRFMNQNVLSSIDRNENPTDYFAVAFLTGTLTSVVLLALVHPLDVVSTRLAVDLHGTQYSGMFDCFFKIVRHEGFSKLWAGFPLGCAALTVHRLIFSALSEAAIPLMRTTRSFQSTSSRTMVYLTIGMVAALLTYPLDTVRHCQMVQPHSARAIASILYNAAGLGAFYSGAAASQLYRVLATLVFRADL